MKHSLILVEGVPGAGKTSTALRLQDSLAERHPDVRLYQEGDPEHPADYEQVARLSNAEYAALRDSHPGSRALLECHAEAGDGELLLPYGKMRADPSAPLPEELLEALAAHDIYEQPPETHTRLLQERWHSFARASGKSGALHIFECCFLQNPLTTLMARWDAGEAYITRHIETITESIRKLNPLLILLYQEELEPGFERIARERPRQWLDFVIDYVTGHAYGRRLRHTIFRVLWSLWYLPLIFAIGS